MKPLKSNIVVVPVHRWPLRTAEYASVARTYRLISEQCDCQLLVPERLASLVKEAMPHWQLKVVADKHLSSIAAYSRMMQAPWFYDNYSSYTYMLLCQPDALLLSNQLEAWTSKGYSYVGAPWLAPDWQLGEPLRFLGVGNGGFSLRKIADFRKVLSGWRYLPSKHHFSPHALLTPLVWVKHRLLFAWNRPPFQYRNNEDLFWGLIVPRSCSFFTIPPAEEALQFAFEQEPEASLALTSKLPMGCHAWEKFNRAFWEEHLPEIADWK